MSSKKSTSKTTAQGEIAELAEQATLLEEAGNWGDAAEVWQRIGSHKNASKKTRAEAKGRAAAARVRAEAKNAKVDVAPEGETAAEVAPTDDDAVADAAPASTPLNDASTEEASTNVPVDEVAPTPSAPETDAPTSDDGAADAPSESVTPDEPKSVGETKPRDARLPEVGTVIQKRDRKGELRCECKVIEGGIEYKGTTYKSLSAAALAASKDLGLGASTLDGWAWWGLKTRPAVPATKIDLGERLERAFAKYRERLAAVIKDASGDDLIKVMKMLKAQGTELITMIEPAESVEPGSTSES